MPNGGSRRLVLAATFAFLVAGTGSAIAGTGVGDVFNLGETNAVNKESVLRGSTNAPMLSVDNARDGAAAMGVDATSIGAGSAVSGTNAGPGYGVRGSSSIGTGVLGLHSNASGARAGVQGQTRSTTANAAGVRGLVTATGPGALSAGVRGEITDDATSSGAGVYARHAGNGYGLQAVSEGPFGYGLFSSGGSYGAFLQANASQAGTTGVYTSGNTRGVDAFAEATTGTSYGVFADADATDGGTGVHGRSDGGTGVNFGVRGEVYSPNGYAGHFESNATGNNGTGVIGLSSDAVAASVPGAYFAGGGEFVGGNGVIGVADRASGYGVVGLQGAGQYAGYFVGNTHVSGTLSKSAGSFRIDHPRDPENKTLSHSFVESPDMKNIYDGEVTLDDDGAATVKLPPYFGALNRDFRYQLTAIGAAAPNLHISQEVSDNRFGIAGGEQGLKVSWQVTGIRKDAYANANRIKVVERKPADERGKYLNPQAFGEPGRMGIAAQTSGNVREDAPPVKKGDTEPKTP